MHHIEAGSFFINYILILERGVDFPEDMPEAELERFGELFETDIGAAGRLAGKWFARMGEPPSRQETVQYAVEVYARIQAARAAMN